MKVALHLVSMPFDRTNCPSIQLGALKSYVETRFGGDLVVYTYPAFFGIVVRPVAEARQNRANPYFDSVTSLESILMRRVDGAFRGVSRSEVGELPYLLLYHRAFGDDRVRGAMDGQGAVVHATSETLRWFLGDAASWAHLDELERATVSYLEDRLLTRIDPAAVNVVGFSCTFSQTYASAYCYQFLRRRLPEVRFLFLFGGSSIGMPTTARTLQSLGVDALAVVGEGEQKLARIVDDCLHTPDGEDIQTVNFAIPELGVVPTLEHADADEKNPAYSSLQLASLDALPTPDYDDYFAELKSKCASEMEMEMALAQVELLVEGSRGCAFACSFCNLNHQWSGYRKQSAAVILDHTQALLQRYGRPESRVRFVDNLCNWASAFADEVLARGARVNAFYELRARYPEHFWQRLKRSGAWMVQIGVEALSTDLLEIIEKEARAIDNVRAMKYLCEQGLTHGSNIITHYPGSTTKHVEETRRVLAHLVHLPPLGPVRYQLVEGSPLYDSLPSASKAELVPDRDLDYVDELKPLLTDFVFRVPEPLSLDPEVSDAWDQLKAWYEAVAAKATFRTERRGHEVWFCDSRWGTQSERTLAGLEARVATECHRGVRFDALVLALDEDAGEVRRAVDALVAERLLLAIDDHYLNVAVRPVEDTVERAAPARPVRSPLPLAR